ncbi:PAS domain-containing hybrid sensor histidine kinase/response regulator [Phaeobacter italicus]|uniref:PAS domain-containing hybrid sensor histidine kinase/response regulator n=1 Tax=Phaeobacter italicus TaxID=481446 RepID=UPI00242E1300|nr:PAS domain-containing hybrid sensor histidine kinase/response regulator [Phaeobacter italicus]MCI5101159.1 ATP-binding protein [Phaeobacter italicus]
MTLLVVAFVTLLIGARAIKDQLDMLEIAESDNIGWNISQLDVDYRGLARAIAQVRLPDSNLGSAISAAELNAIKLAFDIFYSRVTVVSATLNRVGVPAELEQQMQQVRDSRARIAAMVDGIDGANLSQRRQQLEDITAAVTAIGPQIRNMTTQGIQVLTGIQTKTRKDQYDTFVRFHTKSFLILGAVLLCCLLAIRLWRDLEERSRRVQMAATNVTNAIEAAFSSVFFLDTQGSIVQCNRAAEDCFGTERFDLVGIDFAHAFIEPSSLSKFFQYQKAPGSQRIRLMAQNGVGNTFPVQLAGTWEQDFDDNDIYIVFLTDISEQLKAEDKLRASRDEANQASQAKSRFLATMSHEMRTPLHGLIASLDMIHAEHLTPADQALLQTARDCSSRALEQVNGILDHTRTTQVVEKPHPFRPCRVIADVRDELTPLATSKGNRLTLDMSGDGADARYVGLPNAFSRVIFNLLGNAIKFTKNGLVSIELIATRGPTPDTRHLTVIVRDTGCGIAPEDQSRIFERFETATAHGTAGTGLGLAIVVHALEQMQSQIQLRSAPGKGSKFSFSLVLKMKDTVPEPRIAITQESTVTLSAPGCLRDVLIVDDNPINRSVLEQMLQRLGFTPHSASTGEAAVKMAMAKPFSMIFMDVNMPGIDGHEATRRIRTAAGPNADTVVLGATALVPDDLDSPTDSGMNAMLAKPLTMERLTNIIARHMNCEKGAEHGSALDLIDPVKARSLKTQALKDARTALNAMDDTSMSWTAKRDAIHYAVGSTAIVGLDALSRTLVQAEAATKQHNASRLAKCAAQIRGELSSEFDPTV